MKRLLSAEQIEEGVGRMAAEVCEFYSDKPLTVLGVLNGSIVLLADLIRRLDLPLKVGLVQASSYRDASVRSELRLELTMMPDIEGRHVLLIDDIFDTGHTLTNLISQLRDNRPASIRSAVLLRKHGRKAVSMEPDHVAFEIPNEFVVGYGLDYRDAYRNLPYIAVLEQGDY